MVANSSKVYIKTNSDGYVTEINSSGFIPDTAQWVLIDEGIGDKFFHAQNYYFEKPLIDEECNVYNYKFVDGKVIENPNFSQERQISLALSEEQAQIRLIKEQLAATDYKAIKYAEGVISDGDYADIKAQRQAWREKINELEKLIGIRRQG